MRPRAHLNLPHRLTASPPHRRLCNTTAIVRCDKIGAMVEEGTDSPQADLRPVIARLREIERKCASMSSRSEEFPLMQDRVASIITRLEGAMEPSGDPLDYRKIARELFPVAHLFESTGFMSVGKEIAYVERSLIEMAPDSEAVEGRPAQAVASRVISTSAAKQAVSRQPVPHDRQPEAKSVPLPIVFGILLLVLAVAVSVTIVFRIGPFARESRTLDAAPPGAVAGPTALPVAATPAPTPAPTPALLPQPIEIPRGRLAEEVAAARLALAKGDLETAATHLSEAARIDRKEPALGEIADQVVTGLVSWAYAAADNAEWERVDPLLERAERTAMRFGVSTVRIENARKRIAAMEHFVIVGPGDRRSILLSVQRRVEVEVADGGHRSGRIAGINGGNLVLNMDREVGGGVVRYSEEIPLSDIRSLKIYEN